MEIQQNYEDAFQSATELFSSKWMQNCSFAEEFRNKWHRILRTNVRSEKNTLPENAETIFPVSCSFHGGNIIFHFDQEKLFDWFRQDSLGKERRVFISKDLTRGLSGELSFHDSPFHYNSTAAEPSIPEKGTEIFVCSLPGFPPPLQVIYGNKRIERSFHGFKKRKLSFYLIPAEFTPAFLCTPFEKCLYLFWMDCCIMMENRAKLKDKDLKPLLHIFRQTSILTVEKII